MTLLLVFQEVFRSGKATVAAQRLGLSQSAVSHALNRLREIFCDDLFLRRPNGLEPTPLAMELVPQVDALLALAEETLGLGKDFDPAITSAVVRIAAQDSQCTIFGSALATAFQAEAPRLTLVFRPYGRTSAIRMLISTQK